MFDVLYSDLFFGVSVVVVVGIVCISFTVSVSDQVTYLLQCSNEAVGFGLNVDTSYCEVAVQIFCIFFGVVYHDEQVVNILQYLLTKD